MRTSENAQQIARRVVAARFGNAEVAYCAGSIVRGECTEHSDIDLVVVLPVLKAAWRESFLYESWPVEAFVHDSSTLRSFFEEIDARSGVPSPPQMVDEGIAVCGGGRES
jgi:predicted nucleotidyltransferase